MKRNPLQKFIPFRLVLLIAPLLAAWPQQARAANQEWKGASGGTWHTLTNWTSTTGFPGKGTATAAGEGTTADVMTVVAANAATNYGINMNTLGGQLALGAIDFNKTNTAAVTIGNISTTVSGILQLNGAALGVANTLVRNNGAADLTISNVNAGTAAVTMGVRLGVTNGVLDVAASRTLTINPIISEVTAGSGITKTGPGNAVLAGANTYTGPVTVNDGILQVRSNAGNGVLVVNTDHLSASNNNNLQVSGGVTITQPITLENTGNNARVSLEAVSTANANANTWAGDITFKGGTSQALNANSAPLIINGNLLQDASPSAQIFIRGTNTGTINGNINLGTTCSILKTDTSTWQINSTGNVMGPLQCAAGALILNNNDALEPDTELTMGQNNSTTAVLQVNAGFTQQLTGIVNATGSTSTAGHTISGPGTIDFGAPVRNITVPDAANTLNDLTISAPIIGAGGFNKQGAGNLIMNGAVSGPVTVAAGGLGGTGMLSSGVTVNAAAILGAGTATTAGTLTCAGINLQASSNLAINIGSNGNDFIANTGALVSAGTTINVVTVGSLTAGQDIPVIGYTGTSPGVAPFTLVAPLGLGSRATASVVDLGTSIGIHIDTADKSVWTGGASASWDLTGSANWKLASDSSATTYQQSDAVVFDDSGANTSIAITGATTPARAEFINTTAKPYSITGPGTMGGSMTLDKTGNGTVTLTGANTYTGATNVTNGLLIANHNTGVAATAHIIPVPAASPIVVGPAGTFRAIANDTVAANVLTVASPLSGTGTVEINPRATGAGTIGVNAALTADNSAFSGTLKLLAPLAGTYRINNPAPVNLGAASIVVEPGAQVVLTSRTISNPITIGGTGWADANGFIGALRLDSSTYNGNVTVAAGGGRIGAHNSTSTVNGNISGGPLEVNVSNYNNSYTVIFTGANSYSTTKVGGVGGVTPQTTGSPSMRLNIGNGGTSGTLGTGAVTIAGDSVSGNANGTNGVLGFDRSDGYTLGAGNTISVAGSNLARTFVDLDCTGTGFANNGVTIDLGTPGGAAGNLRAGVNRVNTVSTLTGSVETGAFIIGNLTTNPSTNAAVTLASGANVATTSVALATGGSGIPNGTTNGASLTIAAGATLTATGQFFLGEGIGSGATVTQSGNVTLATQLRVGHWGSELSTYNMNGGALLITGDSSLLTPSTPLPGGNGATGDNNINALATATIHGGGIYLGLDGTGVLNHTGGTVTTNWIVLDNRDDSTAGGDGIDRYNISGSALLKLRSEWGLIARNASTDVSLGGGTIQLDNSGTGGSAGNTGPDLDVPLDAILNTVAATTTTLDTNGIDNSFTLPKAVAGSGNLNLTGGGTTIVAGTSASGAYAGTVTVNSGILRIDGVLGGSQIVKSGATLAGGGTGGAVTVESGGILSPGASVGTLSAASVSLQSGSRYDVEITGAATSDKVNVPGSLTSNGTIRVALSGYTPVLNDTFDIADAASFTGTPSFDFTAAVLTAGLGWDTTQFSTNGTIKVVTSSADPFTAWAAGFGLTEGKDGDDDDDGASNLLEFATDADPTSGGSGARAFGRVHVLGADRVLTYTVAVRKSAVFAASGSTQTATKDQVVYVIEASDDLAVWNTVVVTELNAADSASVQAALTLPALDADWEWHSFRTDGTLLLDPLDMVRLSVSAAP